MKVAVYGGSFNPPHLGHVEVAEAVSKALKPDRLLIIPDNIPPHKQMAEGSPSPEERLEMCRVAFSEIPGVVISSMELERKGRSYTSDTIGDLRKIYPGENGENEIFLVIGTDMLLSFESWHNFEYLIRECTLTVLSRNAGEQHLLEENADALRSKYGAKVQIIPHKCIAVSSSELRRELKNRKMKEYLPDALYALIIQRGYYSALPDLGWLRKKAYGFLEKKRVPHVSGCEEEAVRLSRRWGEKTDDGEVSVSFVESAATAAILHDITKKLRENEQLNLFKKYDIVCDEEFLSQPKLFHAVTGAALAKDLFGISDEIHDAIYYHTTAAPDMTLLEKIIYLADYIEPTRDFDGVEALRRLCYENIDEAMELGLKMSMAEIRSRGNKPHSASRKAYEYYRNLNKKSERK